jgi:hypothetical protein
MVRSQNNIPKVLPLTLVPILIFLLSLPVWGSATITDINAWKHPLKKVFLENRIAIEKVELQKEQTIFYVNLPQNSPLEDQAFFEQILVSIAAGNDFWNFTIIDQHKPVHIQVTCAMSNAQIIKAVYSERARYFHKTVTVHFWETAPIVKSHAPFSLQTLSFHSVRESWGRRYYLWQRGSKPGECYGVDTENGEFFQWYSPKDIPLPFPTNINEYQNERDLLNHTLLKACHDGHSEVAEGILANGADLHYQDGDGQTPLHIACSFGHLKLAEMLLGKGAAINCQDKSGRTPFHNACQGEQTSVAALLITHGADLNAVNRLHNTALIEAIEDHNTRMATFLINQGKNSPHYITITYSTFFIYIIGHAGIYHNIKMQILECLILYIMRVNF